jgi:hypothetical protein
MDNSEQFLMITISNENKNRECTIKLNEMKNIKEIKEECKQKLEFDNIDINKINLCFIDGDEDKSIINEFNDLIEYSNIKSGNNNLSIELIAEINEEKYNIKDSQNKENNPIYINKNNEKLNKNIDDDKDRIINKLKAEIEKLVMKCKKYKDQLKELIDKYEKKIHNLECGDSKKENRVLIYENNNIYINDDSQKENINNLNLNSNDIKKYEKKILTRQDVQFIKNKCNKCGKQNDNNIFQCVKCENYYLCPACHKENIKTNNKIHKHKFYFEIKFPDKLMEKIKNKEKNDKEYYEVINKFNDFLNDIFFDKNGNLSKQHYIANKKNIGKFKNLCNEMNKIKEDPFKYFEEYKKETINPKIENMEKEGKHKEMIFLINEKLNLISNNLFKLVPTNEIKTNTNTTTSNYHIGFNIQK